MTASTQEIAKIDVRNILANSGNDYLVAYETLVNEMENQARSTQIVNRSGRVEAFKAAVAKLDRKALAKANKAFKSFLPLVKQNADILHSDEPRLMTIPESESVMEEAMSIVEMKAALDAEWEAIKERTFAHMTEQFAAEGEQFPEHENASIDVPKFGMRFSREGAGRKDAELDEGTLRTLVGEEAWKRITEVEIIPEQRIEHVSIPKLLAYAQNSDPMVLDHLQNSLKVGQWKKPRLNVRKI